MPEGDTLEIARRRLAPILDGQVLRHFQARKLRGHRPRAGQRIEVVRVHGKNLLIDFDRDLTLQVHLGMAGSWSTRDPGVDLSSVLRQPRLRIHLATDKGHALCFAAPTIQTFVRTAALTPVSNLGPDLLVSPEEVDDVARQATERVRSAVHGSEFVHDVLMNQELAAGIGNVYKSEVLFLERLWPFTPIERVDDAVLFALYRRAGRLLWANSRPRVNHDDGRPGFEPRTTTPHGPGSPRWDGGFGGSGRGRTANRYFVYERMRAPCLRCRTPIRRSYRGTTGRSTYWCPTCQPRPRPPARNETVTEP